MSYEPKRRDNIVASVGNWLIRTFASKEYVELLDHAVRGGLAAPLVYQDIFDRIGEALDMGMDWEVHEKLHKIGEDLIDAGLVSYPSPI